MAAERRAVPGLRSKAMPENGTNTEAMEITGPGLERRVGEGLGASLVGNTKEFWGEMTLQRRPRPEAQWCQAAEVRGVVKPLASPQQLQSRPRNGPEGFPSPRGETADACPRPNVGGTRVPPGLCMESQRTDCGASAQVGPRHGKVKEEIMEEEEEEAGSEISRQRFRRSCYHEAGGARDVCRSLQQLCHQWLEPERNSKDRIVELVVLEQFLAILPTEMESWVKERGPETCIQAVALAEDFLLRQREDEKWSEQVSEPFKAVIVNFPEVEPAPTDTLTEIKQESVWDTAAPAGETATSREGHTQPERSGKQERPEPLLGGAERDTLPRPNQGESSEIQPRSHPEGLRGNFINSQGRYEELTVLPAPPRVLQDERLKTCPDCGKGFVWRCQVIEHQRTHTGERPYACSLCGKRFSSKSYVIKHERIHTGEKPYTCPDCGRGFSRRDVLVAHQRTHTGEKPYQCACCGQSFNARERLLVHERVHTGEKPFKCSECERCFRDRSSFCVHKRSHREKPEKHHGLRENI